MRRMQLIFTIAACLSTSASLFAKEFYAVITRYYRASTSNFTGAHCDVQIVQPNL